MTVGETSTNSPWDDTFQLFKQMWVVHTEKASMLREEIQKKQEELNQIEDVLYLLQGALDRSTPLSKLPAQDVPTNQDGYGIASEKESTYVRNTSSDSTRTY